MLGPPKSRDLNRSVLTSLDMLVPKDHFYRHLERTLDLSFVRDCVTDLYATNGRPSIDPVVFFKLQLVLFFEGLRSERQLMRVAADHLSIRWYAGYNLDEPLPDHSSLTRIRQRLGLELFRRFFEHVVELCDKAGLIWGKELLVDATKVRANAADISIVPRLREAIDDHLIDLFADSEDGSGEDPSSSTDAPPLLHPPPAPGFGEVSKMEIEEPSKRWDLLDTCRLDPNRPFSQGYERVSNRKISRTDPDATLITMPDMRTVLGYQTHYMIDGGRARIILHALTMPGDVMENQPFLDQLRRVLFRWKIHPDRVIADTKYSTIENIKVLDAMGITAYMPLRDWEHKTEYFGASHFIYDPDQDIYHCPEGTVLKRSRIEWKAEKTEYRRRVALDVDLDGDQATKTLTHEACHVVAGHTLGMNSQDVETVAESPAFVVLNQYGIDCSGYTFPYVAGWAQDRTILKRNLGAVQGTAHRVIVDLEGESE